MKIGHSISYLCSFLAFGEYFWIRNLVYEVWNKERLQLQILLISAPDLDSKKGASLLKTPFSSLKPNICSFLRLERTIN